MNRINELQSQDSNVKIAAAFRRAYKMAKNWKTWIWLPTILLSLLQLIVAINIQKIISFPTVNLAAYVTAATLLMLMASTIGKHTKINKYVGLGSSLQRLHDFNVLGLGIKPSPIETPQSQINRLSKKWLDKNSQDKPNLSEWWPARVSELGKEKGIALCLLSTFRWETELRKKYGVVLAMIFIVTTALSLFLMYSLNYRIEDYIVRILVPISPFLGLLIDEWLCSRISIDTASKCSDQCFHLWQSNGVDISSELNQLSYIWNGYRANSIPIFDWLYWATQKVMNEDMIIDANALVDEVLAQSQ
ncbi:S-4TM family putative pore-forming effector [Providencia vermicola]|uniref:S-4TM family putative pore-forming effector n=1 Tax=Providencia TaxID=586 RepID=UPI0034E5FA62